jgi:N-acetylglucosaminyldiphosphoundecaprenol N-acetyl-beta-D-mannosaminyltransferase
MPLLPVVCLKSKNYGNTYHAESHGPETMRANVLGVGVHAVNLPLAADMLETAVESGNGGYVCVTGIHGVMEAQRNPRFKKVLDDAMLVVPDGMPTVWVGWWEGFRNMGRVFGPDLMLEVCRRTVSSGHSHFLYGGKPGIAEELQANLERRFPGIRIVGTYTPPFRHLSPTEMADLQSCLSQVAPDIIWVGLSTPKQEQFMWENISSLNCKVMVGVGAAFDIHTGRVNDAPNWVKNAGLQWLHRLCQEPSRLWKRYLINNSAFLIRIALQFAGLKRYELAPRRLAGD